MSLRLKLNINGKAWGMASVFLPISLILARISLFTVSRVKFKIDLLTRDRA